MMKDEGKISYSPSKFLVTKQELSNQSNSGQKTCSGLKETPEPICFDNRDEPIAGKSEKFHKQKQDVSRLKKYKNTGHSLFAMTHINKQVNIMKLILQQPLFESHICKNKQATSMDYGQVSSLFLVSGIVVILVANLINPALMFTVGIILLCSVLFVLGILIFFSWLKHKDDSHPYGVSYGEFAIMFLLAGLASVFLGAGLLLLGFGILFLLGAIAAFILWLKHYKDKIEIKDPE
jgi:hypothetical protein